MAAFMTSPVPARMRVLRFVRVQPGDRVLQHVALSAEELKTSVDTDGPRIGAEGLRLRRVGAGEPARDESGDGTIEQGLSGRSPQPAGSTGRLNRPG